jgi:23S rRNA (adenine2503-C2)-methyltransferase
MYNLEERYFMNRPNIRAFTLKSLEQWLINREIKPYRATQIFKWLFKYDAQNFDKMTDLSIALRQQLAENFCIVSPTIAKVQSSVDGSKKYAFCLHDGNFVESVLIPEKKHYTLCISSQVGCAQGCRFCLTSKQGLIRNLGHDEIVAQVQLVLRDIHQNQSMPLTNIVFMGMGEPLANYDNVKAAIEILISSKYGKQFSTRKITLSTCGIVPNMMKFRQELPVLLAISLNATDNTTRNMLMPINRKYPIEKLLDVCRNYPLRSGRMLTIEYVLIKNINDDINNANRLCQLLGGIRSKINLIPYNPHPQSDFERPDNATIEAFQKTLIENNYTVIIRQSKGSDISAACGQLLYEE